MNRKGYIENVYMIKKLQEIILDYMQKKNEGLDEIDCCRFSSVSLQDIWNWLEEEKAKSSGHEIHRKTSKKIYTKTKI